MPCITRFIANKDDFDCFRNRGYISAVYSKRLSGPGQFLAKNKFCLDPLTPSKVIVSTWKVHVRTYIQTDIQTDRQTDGNFFLLFLSFNIYKAWTFIKRREFFFHSCDYNTFSFYILRMWWESKNRRFLKSRKKVMMRAGACVCLTVFLLQFFVPHTSIFLVVFARKLEHSSTMQHAAAAAKCDHEA